MRPLFALVLVLVLSGCCTSRSGKRDAVKCRQIEESREAAKAGWANVQRSQRLREAPLLASPRVAVGMTAEEVREAWGPPGRVVRQETGEAWAYERDEGIVLVYFRDGRVTGWRWSG